MQNRDFVSADSSRIRKAEKIISCLEYAMGNPLKGKIILEIGGGSGVISNEISKLGNSVICTDINMEFAFDRYNHNRYFYYILADGRNLPFKFESFDIVVCNQVIEHIPRKDQITLIVESTRVLKKGGILYIATPNKIWPIEPHTKLILLSYLPKCLADKYFYIATGISSFDIYLLTYAQLKRILFSQFGQVCDITPKIIKENEKFCINGEIPKILKVVIALIPKSLLCLLAYIYPSWIFICKK